jgi:hypothetical protein
MLSQVRIFLIKMLIAASFFSVSNVHSADVKKEKNCYDELAGLDEWPLKSGLSIRKDALGKLHAILGRDKGKCYLQYLEGAIVWDGEKAYPDGLKMSIRPEKPSYFTVQLALGDDKGCSDLATCLKKSAQSEPQAYRNSVIVNLNNYPGFSIHLNQPPPSASNRDALHILEYEEKTTSGTAQRIFECHGLRSKSVSRPSETKIDQMSEMNSSELSTIDFSNNRSYCVLEFPSFRFRAGGGRLTLNIYQLNEAAQAMPHIENYLSNAIK